LTQTQTIEGEIMQCPKDCGEMRLYEESLMKRKYVCTNSNCNVRLELNTETGEVIQIATGIAAIGAAAGILLAFLAGG